MKKKCKYKLTENINYSHFRKKNSYEQLSFFSNKLGDNHE